MFPLPILLAARLRDIGCNQDAHHDVAGPPCFEGKQGRLSCPNPKGHMLPVDLKRRGTPQDLQLDPYNFGVIRED